MPRGTIKDGNGAAVGDLDLPAELFDVPWSGPLIHQVVTASAAARRAGTHSTLTRSTVHGSGRKPYRQKGTGWARQGTLRAPHMRGGSVAFGPHPRSHAQRIPKKMRRLALRQVLSQRLREERCVFLKEIDLPSGKTKDLGRLLAALELAGEVLFIVPQKDENLVRSTANLPGVRVALADHLSASLLIGTDFLVLTPEAVSRLGEVYAP